MKDENQNHIVEPNKKVSSVDWLLEQLNIQGFLGTYCTPENIYTKRQLMNQIIEQAKAMHKEEIIQSYASGSNDRLKNTINTNYHNETFQ